MIIIEGLDATGKSTLANHIAKLTGWPIKPTEGPEKYPGEAFERCKRYLSMPDNTIFDRHPIISQNVYGVLRGTPPLPPYIVMALKRRSPFIIEASPRNELPHTEKDYDTPEHLALIRQRKKLAEIYDIFFQQYFPDRVIYRLADLRGVVREAVGYAKRHTEEESHTEEEI